MTTDGTNFYVTNASNHTVLKVVISTGEVTTLAGADGSSGSEDGTGAAASFNSPSGITTDGTRLYVADRGNHAVRRVVIATGEVTTLAGLAGRNGFADGTGAAARFNFPSGITTDGTSLYVADEHNNTVRKIAIGTGEVTTLAGAEGPDGFTDDVGAAARFNGPYGITTDGMNLYVTEKNFHTVRKIAIATGAVTTLTGARLKSNEPPGVLNYRLGITTDGANLYVTDGEYNMVWKFVPGTGSLKGVAGRSTSSGSADGLTGAARFYDPGGITTDGTNLYVADEGNSTIRKIAIATGSVTTLAGAARLEGSTDGVGAAARFRNPSGIATDGTNLYVTDRGNHTIRKVAIATGAVTTLAGKAGIRGFEDGTGDAATFDNPYGITTDGTNLYVADVENCRVRKVVIATGAVTTLATKAIAPGSTVGTGATELYFPPFGITTDGSRLYVTDAVNHAIWAIE